MVEGPKYPAQRLTEEDKEILYKVAINYVITFYNLTQEHPNPKLIAKRIVSKVVQSDKYISTLHMLAYIKNSPTNQILEPGEINEKLANDIKNSIEKDISAKLEDDKNNNKKFLHPSDLSDVLKKLEEHDILLHLEGKKEIRDRLHKNHHGKKSLSVLVRHSRGGKLSVYLVKEDVEKLKRAMEKPEAIEYLHTEVVRTGLAHKIMKYLILASLHCLKMNENVGRDLMEVGAAFFQEKMNEQENAKFKNTLQILQSIDDEQLGHDIDDLTKSLIHDRGYYILLFIIGLLKLSYC